MGAQGISVLKFPDDLEWPCDDGYPFLEAVHYDVEPPNDSCGHRLKDGPAAFHLEYAGPFEASHLSNHHCLEGYGDNILKFGCEDLRVTGEAGAHALIRLIEPDDDPKFARCSPRPL